MARSSSVSFTVSILTLLSPSCLYPFALPALPSPPNFHTILNLLFGMVMHYTLVLLPLTPSLSSSSWSS
ncbi:uncharacterized protein EV420DRAFT_1555715 [Desarmillaria tabescens]|uniref:Uncharacterized protein n=1 Tax=Armillaria tabescens TaxID=1929756 RepID=A0AA39K429_ARMTA|nr:uncharacterized protein EV420DRAFT_1555715 [Desarmillaria tabescens]KAK0454207.1 hypothetical protein EV420DRAFT_1555715 [Desarmillaria tabescens]